MSVPRSNIADVDHPGNVAATLGAVLLGYGIINIAVGASQCDEKGAAFCTGVFTPAALGLGLGIYGLAVWISSVRAMSSDGQRSRSEIGRLLLTPTVMYAHGKSSPGLALVSSF